MSEAFDTVASSTPTPTAELPLATPPGLWSLAPSAFLPAMIYEIGTGAVTPIVVTTATDLGASTALAAFTLALLGVGRVIGDVPASFIAERLGDRRSMIVAALFALCGYVACMEARSIVVLCIALTFIGMTSSTFYLARQAYLIEVVPVPLRARAMSTLAGSHRIGLFIGPFVGALAISLGGVRAAYVVAMATALFTAVILFVIADVDVPSGQDTAARGGVSAARVLLDHRRLFLTLGFAVIGVGAVRQARQTVLPLWAQHIGLSPAQTSLVFGIASAVDVALFYPSGKVMDRYGRLAIALPAMATMGIAMILLPLTHTIVAVTIVSMVISLGNGIGSGIMQTLGADAAPREGRRRFLGIWRMMGDAGQAAGPVIVSAVAAIATLAVGIVAIGSVGLLAATALAKWVPKYSAYATVRSVRAHRLTSR